MCGQRFSDIGKVLDRKHILEDGIQIYQQKTNERVIIPLHSDLKRQIKYLFRKYPEKLPTINNQDFNKALKELCRIAGFDREHSWLKLVGKEKIKQTDFRFNLVSTHTGRRTFCVQWLKNGQSPEWIMKVCGWRSYDQFKEYVKVDDEDITESFKGSMYGNDKKQKQSTIKKETIPKIKKNNTSAVVN